MKKKLSLFILVIGGVALLFFYYRYSKNNTSSNGFDISIKTEKKEILRIAEDTAIKIYGNNIIQNERPLIAKLENDSIWTVTGTLEKGVKGGAVHIEILRRNRKILHLTHYK